MLPKPTKRKFTDWQQELLNWNRHWILSRTKTLLRNWPGLLIKLVLRKLVFWEKDQWSKRKLLRMNRLRRDIRPMRKRKIELINWLNEFFKLQTTISLCYIPLSHTSFYIFRLFSVRISTFQKQGYIAYILSIYLSLFLLLYHLHLIIDLLESIRALLELVLVWI